MRTRSPAVRRARLTRAVATVLAAATMATAVVAAFGTTADASASLDITVTGATGEVRLPRPPAGEPCNPATSRGFSGQAQVERGGFESNSTASLAVHLDLVRGQQGGYYLRDDSSAVTLNTARGAVRLELTGGTCQDPALTGDDQVAGSGTWSVSPVPQADGAMSYRDVTGSGTFLLQATLHSGAANTWTLKLTGDLTVLQPALEAKLVRSYWAHAGVDYAGRLMTAIYEFTNNGPGDAYDVRLDTATGPTGITALEWTGETLGTLRPGEKVRVTVRWRVKSAPGQGPVLTGRRFVAGMAVVAHDVRDTPRPAQLQVSTVSPAFPPAL